MQAGLFLQSPQVVKACSECVMSYQVVVSRFSVRNGGKPSQTISIDVDPQWITGGHQHIHSQIKLEIINEKWLQRRPALLYTANTHNRCDLLLICTAVPHSAPLV